MQRYGIVSDVVPVSSNASGAAGVCAAELDETFRNDDERLYDDEYDDTYDDLGFEGSLEPQLEDVC